MAVFRVEKTRDYTVMANHHLKNRELSLKAKGLLSVMLSLPDNWDYTLKGLSHINREGVDAIREAVKELERAGYIVRTRVRNEKGQLTHTEYVIYEKPRKPEITSPALGSPVQGKPVLGEPALENPTLDDPALEHPTQFNTYGQNTDPEKTYSPNPHAANPYPSNPHPSMTREDGSDKMERAVDSKMYRRTRAQVQMQIDYDALVNPGNRLQLDEIVELMTETLCTNQITLRIAGCTYDAEIVKERFARINAHHIEYVFDSLSKKRTPVRNIKQYLLTTLFNAPATIDCYYDAEVRHAGIV